MQYDLKTKKMFLKRCTYPDVALSDLYLGQIIMVYSRQLKIVEYGDLFTRNKFAHSRQRTFAMLKPDVYTSAGKIIDSIYQSGFTISRLKMSRFNQNLVDQFYGEHKGKPFYDNLSNFITSDVVIGAELIADNAIEKWRAMIGPTNTQTAQQHAPNTLRA